MVAEKLAKLKHGQTIAKLDGGKLDAPIGASRKSQAEAAKVMGVAKRNVQRARVVCEKGVPGLAEAVERGDCAATMEA